MKIRCFVLATREPHRFVESSEQSADHWVLLGSMLDYVAEIGAKPERNEVRRFACCMCCQWSRMQALAPSWFSFCLEPCLQKLNNQSSHALL